MVRAYEEPDFIRGWVQVARRIAEKAGSWTGYEIAKYHRALRKNPGDQALYLALAELYLARYSKRGRNEDWGQAVNHFREAHDLGWLPGSGYVGLASEAKRRGEEMMARRILRHGMQRHLERLRKASFGMKDARSSMEPLNKHLREEGISMKELLGEGWQKGLGQKEAEALEKNLIKPSDAGVQKQECRL